MIDESRLVAITALQFFAATADEQVAVATRVDASSIPDFFGTPQEFAVANYCYGVGCAFVSWAFELRDRYQFADRDVPSLKRFSAALGLAMANFGPGSWSENAIRFYASFEELRVLAGIALKDVGEDHLASPGSLPLMTIIDPDEFRTTPEQREGLDLL